MIEGSKHINRLIPKNREHIVELKSFVLLLFSHSRLYILDTCLLFCAQYQKKTRSFDKLQNGRIFLEVPKKPKWNKSEIKLFLAPTIFCHWQIFKKTW